MKIFAVINNYPDPEERSPFITDSATPDWYELPDSSVLRSGNPFFVPDFAGSFRAFPSIIFRIGRLGKSIASRFSSRYIDGVTMGCAVVATDLLASLRERRAPWTRATAFDRSLLLGNLQPIETLLDLGVAEVTCGRTGIEYNHALLKENIGLIIERLSAENTLKNGDIILAGLSAEGIPLTTDTRLQIRIKPSNLTVLDISIK